MVPYAEENMPLRWVFQQDNDPKHTSRLLSTFFEDQKVDVLKWPRQPSDLNTLKNLLGGLKKKLAKHSFSNKQKLSEGVQKLWYETPVETCQALIKSMPKRIAVVAKNRGGYTGY